LNILALETSSEWCSAALWLDGRVLAACDAIAFGAGPGSFTGLRIACGVAQGLGFAAGLPLAGVSTLLALAQASGAERVLSCLDARMGEIYCAAFERRGGQWSTTHPPRLCAPVAAPLLEGEGWIGAGSGFAVHATALQERYGMHLVRPDLHPHAQDIAALGAEMVRAGLALPAEQAHPIYLRDRVAFTVDERQAIKAARSAKLAAESP
jgi:tRNA threonylcarbamoyladenosine biosynthesis protein TsaB